MRISAAVKSIKSDIDREIARGQRAVRGGIADATTALKLDLRKQVVSAGLGSRLANTWQSNVRPKGPSLDADGMVWSMAPHVIRGYSTGALLRNRSGMFLAVPLKAAGMGPRRTKITPAGWEKRTGKKLIPIRRPNGNIILVTDAGTGGFTKRGAARVSKRAGRATIPIFVLVRQVKLPRFLAPERAADKAVREVPRRIESRWKGAA